jgi:molecular chaperone DnaK
VTATERATGLARHVTIDNAMERFRQRQRTDAVDRLDEVFGTAEAPIELGEDEYSVAPGTVADPAAESLSPALRQAIDAAAALAAKAEKIAAKANPEDATELRAMLVDLRAAVERRSVDDIQATTHEIEDLVFYLEDQ